MRNKPSFSFFKNLLYALDGLRICFKEETSFKIELFVAILLSIAIWLASLHPLSKVILQSSLLLPLIAELFNSAIEHLTDLCTKKHHPLAKSAKDMGAAAVLLTLLLTLGIWIAVGLYEYK